jgi:hypothetical protein
MQRVVECASCDASQSEGCKASGAAMDGWEVMWIRLKLLYEYTVLFESGFGKAYLLLCARA